MSSFLMLKKLESEDYMAVNRGMEFVGGPDKPVVREWIQVFNFGRDYYEKNSNVLSLYILTSKFSYG